jgi:hypothetical protein
VSVFTQYWKLYGGTTALLRSAYLYAAIAITVMLYPIWSQVERGLYTWPQITIDIVPSLLGFSMGGMAIMLAFSGANAFSIIAEDGEPKSLFIKVITSFFHFILVQTISIVLALLTVAYNSFFLSLLGFLSLSYSLMVAIATAGQLLQVATILNATASLPAKDASKKNSSGTPATDSPTPPARP